VGPGLGALAAITPGQGGSVLPALAGGAARRGRQAGEGAPQAGGDMPTRLGISPPLPRFRAESCMAARLPRMRERHGVLQFPSRLVSSQVGANPTGGRPATEPPAYRRRGAPGGVHTALGFTRSHQREAWA